uniref:RNA polymerase I subunit E n=1 Tax=Oncorhynchus kisutch TaxID=8019 RepID=A0A8C7K5X6_ONCKI
STVQFSNGTLRNTQQLDFSFYKNVDETNPRKKNRRMLVAESDRLSYVGNNFGTGSLKCNNLCKYYVGVLNKETMRMEVHNAQLFNMQPVIPGESSTENDASQNTDLTYREKVDSLIEAFGTNKQKRALTSRRLNQVGSETLQSAVAKAAHSIIDQKGLEGNTCIPTSTHLQYIWEVFRPLIFLHILLRLCLCFLVGQEDGCPRIIHIKLMRTFTVETFNNGCINVVSTSMRVKVAAYCLALLLHMGDMTADLTLLHRDLGVTEKRMVEVAKSMGLTLSRHGCVTGDDGGPTAENRLASLRLPLVKYQTFTEIRKRKKMH